MVGRAKCNKKCSIRVHSGEKNTSFNNLPSSYNISHHKHTSTPLQFFLLCLFHFLRLYLSTFLASTVVRRVNEFNINRIEPKRVSSH